jgi:3-dehydroquinate dehydratase/shikimate dehydrogenase
LPKATPNEGFSLCVSVAAPDPEAALALAARARGHGAGLVEYRLDAFAGPTAEIESSLPSLLERSPLPAIVTFRLPADGGLRGVDEAARMSLLRAALGAGAAWVDVEFGREGGIAADAAGRLIVSHHDFERTPADLADIARRIEEGPADVVKLATMATSAADAFACYDVLRAAKKPTVAFTMGPLGSASRVVTLALGAPWTYAALSGKSDDEVAPGQLPLPRLVNEFRVGRLKETSALYGVIGHPVGHSMSPAMLNAAFDATETDAVYLPFEVDADPGAFVRRMSDFGAAGFSVTIPHKVDVMGALDDIEPAARHIGAVNTVIARGGRLTGTNTDLYGAMDAIASAAGGADALAGKRALVLGAGGAARAIVFGLVEAGMEVTLTDIDGPRAAELASASGAEAVDPERAGEAAGDFDVVANATPVGMHPNEDATPLDAARLHEGQTVFDAVYNPLETRLLREAAARGCRTVRGVEMFVRQGARQFELWTGGPAPVDVMRESVLERLGR